MDAPVEGAHGEMDRNLLERMKAPFEHMLRNALAHGIETPGQRQLDGKPGEGTVNIAVSGPVPSRCIRAGQCARAMASVKARSGMSSVGSRPASAIASRKPA